jgi:hypothetical protein
MEGIRPLRKVIFWAPADVHHEAIDFQHPDHKAAVHPARQRPMSTKPTDLERVIVLDRFASRAVALTGMIKAEAFVVIGTTTRFWWSLPDRVIEIDRLRTTIVHRSAALADHHS